MSQESLESLDKFLFTLDWLLAVMERCSGHIEFGLVHVDFGNPRILGEAFGAQQASQKLDEVYRILCKSLRKTDLVARDGVDFWILVPYTPATEKLSEKLGYIVETASENGLEIVERDISIFSLKDSVGVLPSGRSAAEFLGFLKQHHTSQAAKESHLPARQ